MVEAVVEFVLENLKQTLTYNVELISGIYDEVESLYKKLLLLKCFLKDSKLSESKCVRELFRLIRDLAYEAEDIIDASVGNAAMQRSRSTLSRIAHLFEYHTVARDQINSIKRKVEEIYDEKLFAIKVLKNGAFSTEASTILKRVPIPKVEEDNVVSFDEEAKIVVGRLTNGPKQLKIISVIGMGGLGKTTLARKVYKDPSIENHFVIRAWVYVSQEFSRKEVFISILSKLTKFSNEMFEWSEEKLVENLHRQLSGDRYLIVMDDVWTTEAWNDLKIAFPYTHLGSRILLTSRNTLVALHANRDHDSPPHHLRLLTHDESWELLHKKVFPRGRIPSELIELGQLIAKRCHGLPLAIVVVAGLLFKKDKTPDWWRIVAESVSLYVARDPNQCMDVLALSYKHLPDHLKVCFIYFGSFPEDFAIPVWKLLRLWVAEGFVQQLGRACLEDIAEEYLEDLVERNLIMVEQKRSNGRIKACRIHGMLRDLCLREGAQEKFLLEIKENVQDSSSLSSIVKYQRRLCAHSHILNFIRSKPYSPHVRSFLCFPSEETSLPREHTSFIGDTFKLVRVLDIQLINLSRFPNEIVQLVHLRYVALLGEFKVLPAPVSKLWNLQSLILETRSRNLDIQADIWKMLQFRHLHTSSSSHLHGPPAESRNDNEDIFVRRNVQTISTISPESCTENILGRTPRLKKLGIRGKIVKLMQKKEMFDNITKLENLETLKLLNDTFPNVPTEVGLPQWYKFPPRLKKLTLSDTLLDWKHMSTLAMLPNLEVLKLKEYAFQGSSWKPVDGGFRLLKVLKLGRTDLVHWDASSHHFPRLEHIVLEHCINLVAMPSGLGDVTVLHTVELYHTPSATQSARLIQQQKEKLQQHNIGNNGFKLLIYPPEA